MENCKLLYDQMQKRDAEMERTVLCDTCPSLFINNKDYRKVHFIILDKNGHSINCLNLEKLGITIYAAIEDYLICYERNYKEIECPPDYRTIAYELYKYNKLNIMILLYSLFSKMCISIRRRVAYAADADAAAYAAAYAAYAADAAAYAAAYAAADADAYAAYAAAAYAAADADAAADAAAYAAADAAAAKRNSREAFKKLITLRKIILKEGGE